MCLCVHLPLSLSLSLFPPPPPPPWGSLTAKAEKSRAEGKKDKSRYERIKRHSTRNVRDAHLCFPLLYMSAEHRGSEVSASQGRYRKGQTPTLKTGGGLVWGDVPNILTGWSV